jgi:hypothetical protein
MWAVVVGVKDEAGLDRADIIPAGVSETAGGYSCENFRISSLVRRLTSVGATKKEKGPPISHRRHQIGHLDFGSIGC